jgi:hypothetical protein
MMSKANNLGASGRGFVNCLGGNYSQLSPSTNRAPLSHADAVSDGFPDGVTVATTIAFVAVPINKSPSILRSSPGVSSTSEIDSTVIFITEPRKVIQAPGLEVNARIFAETISALLVRSTRPSSLVNLKARVASFSF